jgi:hypothetical protein
LHDDQPYWTNQTRDVRIGIKAIAYKTLIQNFPETPGLRADLIRYCHDASPTSMDSDAGDASSSVGGADSDIINSLLKLFHKDWPNAGELRSLLGSRDAGVNEMALDLIRYKGDASMMADVAHLLTTSQDRRIQYLCISTLCDLSCDRFDVAYTTFMAHPDDYVKDWVKLAAAPAGP